MTERDINSVSLWRFAPLVVAGLLAILFLAGLFMGDPSRLPSAYQDKNLPPFSLPGLVQKPGFERKPGITQADLATGSPVLLNIWASWCGPCRDEHPILMQLADAGVVIFGLNYKDNEAAAQRFLGRLGNPYQEIGVDKTGRVAIELGVYGVPETFLLDARGRVVARHVGPLDAKVLQEQILPYLQSQATE